MSQSVNAPARKIEQPVRCRNCGYDVTPPHGGLLIERCPACGVPICARCGCSEDRACAVKCTDGLLTCEWVQPGLCSFCLYKVGEEAYATVTSGRRIRFGQDLLSEPI